MNLIDTEVYQRAPTLRLAYLDGRLELCEEIKELAHILLAQNNISPFRPSDDFQKGQVAALTAIIEACMTIEDAAQQKSVSDKKYDA